MTKSWRHRDGKLINHEELSASAGAGNRTGCHLSSWKDHPLLLTPHILTSGWCFKRPRSLNKCLIRTHIKTNSLASNLSCTKEQLRPFHGSRVQSRRRGSTGLPEGETTKIVGLRFWPPTPTVCLHKVPGHCCLHGAPAAGSLQGVPGSRCVLEQEPVGGNEDNDPAGWHVPKPGGEDPVSGLILRPGSPTTP